MTYTEFIVILKSYAEPAFADFQRRLISTKYEILGVRTPTMRALAKEYRRYKDEILAFPNKYYEVVFIKLTIVSALPYEEFLKELKNSVSLMDNWALCDCFKAKCIPKNRERFLTEIESIFSRGGEYFERYALVALLFYYVDKPYLPLIENYLSRAHTEAYYVHMAAAWLTAETLIKEYDYGISLLKKRILPNKTHNKAIQKAIESYRLTYEQKEYLCSLKISKNKFIR